MVWDEPGLWSVPHHWVGSLGSLPRVGLLVVVYSLLRPLSGIQAEWSHRLIRAIGCASQLGGVIENTPWLGGALDWHL